MPTQVDNTTRQVLEHHLGALTAGDLDAILGDYTDDSTLIGPDGPVRGRQAIRAFFESGLDSLFKPGTYEFTMDKTQVADDIAYISLARELRSGGHRVWHGYVPDQRRQDRGPDLRRENRSEDAQVNV